MWRGDEMTVWNSTTEAAGMGTDLMFDERTYVY